MWLHHLLWLLIIHRLHIIADHLLHPASHLVDQRAAGKYTLQADFTRLLAFVLDWVPFVRDRARAKCRQFDCSLAHNIHRHCILVADLNPHVVSHVFDINVKILVPDRLLASVVLDLSLERLLSDLDVDKWVHLGKPFSVSGELGFCNREPKFAILVRHNFKFSKN